MTIVVPVGIAAAGVADSGRAGRPAAAPLTLTIFHTVAIGRREGLRPTDRSSFGVAPPNSEKLFRRRISVRRRHDYV